MKTCLRLLLVILPWPLRRWFLTRFLGYQIHPTARIGWAWVFPERLIMEEHSRIGHLTVCKGLELLQLGAHSSIGRLNWITGFPRGDTSFFGYQVDRNPKLELGSHSAIGNRHLIDCTASVTFGSFCNLAGFRSQILTHSIDIKECRQSSAPATIGNYCFVGTDTVILGGSNIPSYCVVGAKSLVNKKLDEELMLYGGVPVKPLRKLSMDYKYFSRPVGIVK
jgi:acetyltransferase-like isoleucine patch superfamily enzyme